MVCGLLGQNALSHVAPDSSQDLEIASMVSLASIALAMNINKLNAMPLIKVSPCGPIGQNALQHVEAALNQEDDPIFAPMKLTNRQSHAMHTLVHGPLGVSGQHAVLLVVAVTLTEIEFTLALANARNKQCGVTSTQDLMVPGLLGQIALQHVMVAPNIDHVSMIVANRMTSRPSSVVAPDDTPAGPPGPPVPYAMNSSMNLLWHHDQEYTIAVLKVKFKKRLVSHHDVPTGQLGADGQVAVPRVVQVFQHDHVNVTAMTNFA